MAVACCCAPPFARRLLLGPTRAHLFRAPTEGSGKGRLIDGLALTAMDALVRALSALADRTSRPRADVRQRIELFVEARAKMVHGR